MSACIHLGGRRGAGLGQGAAGKARAKWGKRKGVEMKRRGEGETESMRGVL